MKEHTEYWDLYDAGRRLLNRTHPRGLPMNEGEYHVVVHVWVVNDRGEALISKRDAGKPYPLLWECTGGSALAGEDSLTAALRETHEELGVRLRPENGTLLASYQRPNDFVDVWLFRQNIDISSVILQPGETIDAKWAGEDDIRGMLRNGEFAPLFPYLDTVFCPDIPVAFFTDAQPETLQFAVIAARYGGKWLFVRHKDRDTYEIPGGHIEPGETALDAARRELAEETGATRFDIEFVCHYGVCRGRSVTYGALFIADVSDMGDLPPEHEMRGRILSDDMPRRLTYPSIQPKLFNRVIGYDA